MEVVSKSNTCVDINHYFAHLNKKGKNSFLNHSRVVLYFRYNSCLSIRTDSVIMYLCSIVLVFDCMD